MTPSEQERDARKAVAGAHSLGCSFSFGRSTLCDCGGVDRPIAHLDQYRLAVRRAAIAEAVAVVEAERLVPVASDDDESYNDGIHDALTALRGLSPEGM